MRAISSLLSPLAAAMFGAAAIASPAAAQQSATPEYARPAVQRAAVGNPAPVRTLANYKFAAPRVEGMPAHVSVADSAGQLVSSFRLPGGRAAYPMRVEVVDTDLVLQGETPAGVLTLRLVEQNDTAEARPITGRWWLGRDEGDLRGRIAR